MLPPANKNPSGEYTKMVSVASDWTNRNSDREVDRYSAVDDIVAPSNERLADENPRVARNCSTGCNQPTVVANRLLVVLPAAGTGGGFGQEDGLDSRDWTLRDDRPPRSGKWHAGGVYSRDCLSSDDRLLPSLPFHSHWPTLDRYDDFDNSK